MDDPSPRRVAVSYSWKEEREGDSQGAVEKFCGRLQRAGIEVVRDVDELKHGQCISEFMRNLGASDCLCVFLSEAYLQSPNCMYELLIAWQRSKDNPEEFRDRVKVWLMPGLDAHKFEARDHFRDFWRAEYERREELIGGKPSRGLPGSEVDEKNRIGEIADHVQGILHFVANSLSPASVDEFQTWIANELGGDDSGSSDDIFPRTLAETNRRLRENPDLAKFLHHCSPDLFNGPADLTLKPEFAGAQSPDLIDFTERVIEGLRSAESPGGDFARRLTDVIGGFLVLGVNPRWVCDQRRLAAKAGTSYQGDEPFKTVGTDRVYFLELVIRALGDSCARLNELLRTREAADPFEIPRPAKVLKGVTETDRRTELKRAFIKHIHDREPRPEDVDALFAEAREIISDALKRDGRRYKPYYTTDPEYRRHVETIKGDLRLHDLFVILPAGGSESEMVDRAHLLVPRICELADLLEQLQSRP